VSRGSKTKRQTEARGAIEWLEELSVGVRKDRREKYNPLIHGEKRARTAERYLEEIMMRAESIKVE